MHQIVFDDFAIKRKWIKQECCTQKYFVSEIRAAIYVANLVQTSYEVAQVFVTQRLSLVLSSSLFQAIRHGKLNIR